MRSRTRCSPRACTWQGEELPLRAAQAQARGAPDDYREREELGELQALRSADFNDDRLELITAREELDAELSGIADPVARNEEEKQISLRDLERALAAASRTRRRRVGSACAQSGSSVCSGPSVATSRRRRTSRGSAGSRRSSRPTRRSARSRSAWTRSRASASTSRTTRTCGSTSRTVRRSRRVRA